MTHATHEQRTAIVTGAARGIGAAVARRLAYDGLAVGVIDLDEADCVGTVEAITSSGGSAMAVAADVSDETAVTAAVARITAVLGPPTVLVNNAGTSPKGPGGTRLNSLATDIETWQSMYNTNFYAPLLLTRGFAGELAKARGAVVNLTSIAGSRVHPFAGSAYATSKAALAALTREMAFDLAAAGVRVNAVAPGEIDTTILSPGTSRIVDQDIPMHRLGTIEEVADLIWFLCSPQAKYITGAEIPINGGQHV